MIDGLNRDIYNDDHEDAGLDPSAGGSSQGTSGVDRPLLQRSLAYATGRRAHPTPTHTNAFFSQLVGLVPYDVVRGAAHVYRRLQLTAWPEAVDKEIAAASQGFLRATGLSRDSDSFRKWEREYRTYSLCALPAQLTAVIATRSPRRVESRIRYADDVSLEALLETRAIIAVSRTGLSFVLPWLLTARGRSVALVAQPSARANSLLSAFPKWSQAGEIKLIGADALALLRARNAIGQGSTVVIFPESFASRGRRTTIRFMKTNVQAPLGAAAISSQLKLPIQPVCITASGNGAYVQFGPRLHPQNFLSQEMLTHALFEQLAFWVLEYPSQWVGWQDLASHLQRRGES